MDIVEPRQLKLPFRPPRVGRRTARQSIAVPGGLFLSRKEISYRAFTLSHAYTSAVHLNFRPCEIPGIRVSMGIGAKLFPKNSQEELKIM